MKIKEISVSLSRKLQLKQYEPVNFNYAATAELEEGEDPREAYRELKKLVKKQLDNSVAAVERWKKLQMDTKDRIDAELADSAALFTLAPDAKTRDQEPKKENDEPLTMQI